METLSLNGVSYAYKNRYRTTYAVKDVSYTFQRGLLYCVIGKSGSGKTTLLSMLCGLDVPTEGAITWDGVATSAMDRDAFRRNHVSVIYQSLNLFPLLTVMENVTYPLRLKKVPAAQAIEIAREKLREVGLTEDMYRCLPAMLSGGEQQRVAIARSLTSSTEVILADEPTGNLDTGNTANIISILKKMAHEENRCIIVVTHDPAVSAQADRVLTMSDGVLTPEDTKA